ncbi:MAG TPA: HAD family hydrolase [archaeon]|nr:HAD family hydrolase [archaeon]
MENVLDKQWFELATLYPGSRSILSFCKKSGLLTTLVCNGSTDTKKVLKQLDIDKYFDYVVISEEVGHEKSDLVPFKLVLQKFHIKSADCLMVGNRADEDLKAKKVGIKTCLVEYFKFPNVGKPEKPDFKIKDIRELKRIIEKLTKSS